MFEAKLQAAEGWTMADVDLRYASYEWQGYGSTHPFGPLVHSSGPFIWSIGPFIWSIHLVHLSIHSSTHHTDYVGRRLQPPSLDNTVSKRGLPLTHQRSDRVYTTCVPGTL